MLGPGPQSKQKFSPKMIWYLGHTNLYCQTPDYVFRLGVDFVLPLSQQQQEPLTEIYQNGVY